MAEVKVVENERKRLNIAISERAKDDLDSIKHPGQTYDGIIQELINLWKRVKEREATRLKKRS